MEPTRLPRRTAIGMVAATGVALPVLAGCGDDGTEPGQPTDPGSPTEATSAAPEQPTDTTTPEEQGLIAASDVPVGGGVILSDERVVITQPEAGEFQGFSAACTHQGCLVTGVSETIDCACHGSRFSLQDGSVASGPATAPLPPVELVVDGDQIRLG